MTTLAARTIDALRYEHDALAGLVPTYTDAQLTGGSGASEWSVAQVLSHLGSGSEITHASLRAALGEAEAPDDDFNRSVWDRWDAMAPTDQRDGFLEHNQVLVEALEALTPEQHESLQVPIGFLPAPLSVASYAGLRLNEVAHHSWDVRVATDPAAGLLGSSADVLPDHMLGDLGFLLGFLGKADQADERIVLALGDTGYRLVVDDAVSVGSADDEVTATFSGATEAALRLVSGRLGPQYTPADVAVSGNVSLDGLRAVFPGF
ncbi:MAG TPA: maleylpyruvate isomerase N-terminal domain-containing protein [Marmoricola sp.]|jgi:uncharacterized protein (TIGR03083 family)|nr:maleylpyruvate isomerase N-terminal domain-containing protein [Marmoricola sp.]